MNYAVGLEQQKYFQRRYGDIVLALTRNFIPTEDGQGLIVDYKTGVPRPGVDSFFRLNPEPEINRDCQGRASA